MRNFWAEPFHSFKACASWVIACFRSTWLASFARYSKHSFRHFSYSSWPSFQLVSCGRRVLRFVLHQKGLVGCSVFSASQINSSAKSTIYLISYLLSISLVRVPPGRIYVANNSIGAASTRCLSCLLLLFIYKLDDSDFITLGSPSCPYEVEYE